MKYPKNPPTRLSPTKYRKLKEYIYERDGECVRCHDQRTAECHHVIKRSAGGSDAPNNLVRLCCSCHAKIERYQIKLPLKVVKMIENEPGEL